MNGIADSALAFDTDIAFDLSTAENASPVASKASDDVTVDDKATVPTETSMRQDSYPGAH